MPTQTTTTFVSKSRARCGPHQYGRHQRGQSIVVALLVLLLLGFVGALFITIVARNLVNARHASRVLTADKYATAGLVYADAQLTNSLDGADWRPPLQYEPSDGTLGTTDYRPGTGPAGGGTAAAAGDSRERLRYKAKLMVAPLLSLTTPPYSNDPDAEYLNVGYARYNTGLGRFLLRVTYDPINIGSAVVPPGKYLKIESIGREGNIDPIDPTTYQNNRSTDRTQAYQVAYKPIGITDYARFETNPDNRSDIANLGVMSQVYTNDPDTGDTSAQKIGILTPGVYDFTGGTTTVGTATTPDYQLYPITTTYGAPDAYLSTGGVLSPNPTAGTATMIDTTHNVSFPGGGSIHANMPVRFFGKNVVYLNDANLNAAPPNAPFVQDGLEIAGNLLLDSYDPTTYLNNSNAGTTGTPPVYTGQQAALSLNPSDLSKPITSVNAPAAPGTLLPSAPAYLSYLVAPSNVISSQGSSVNYGFDTHDGLIRDGSMQNDINGKPRGIKRLEPPVMDGVDPGSSLPRYRAIASLSPLRPNLKNPDGTPYVPAAGANASLYGYGKSIYIDNTSDVQSESTAIGGGTTLTDEWLHRAAPAGVNVKSGWQGPIYSPVGVSITLGQPLSTSGGTTTYGLRMVRSDAQVHWKNPDGTAGTSATLDVPYTDLDADRTSANPGAAADNDLIIYAEGNVRLSGILSPNEGTGTSAFIVPRHITIVTNATAYIEGNLLKGSPDSSVTVLAHDYVCVNTTQFLAGTTQDPIPAVSVTNSKEFELSNVDTLVQNFSFGLPASVKTTDSVASGGYGGTPSLYVSASSNVDGTTAAAKFSFASLTGTAVSLQTSLLFTGLTPTHTTTPLTGLPALTQTDTEQIQTRRDPNNTTAQGDVLLDRVAVLPMDIRIEAVLYAQTRSFFVIPGDWFNTSPDDTINGFVGTITATNTGGTRNYGGDQRFPLYGQPIDLKITIDGSVCEARPADIAAQSAWMLKWGWIPQGHGTSLGLTGGTATESAGHPGRIGLQIIYNPQAGYPYSPGATAATKYYLRSDAYGRPLPFAPKLPVSTALLYAGESSEPPLLQ